MDDVFVKGVVDEKRISLIEGIISRLSRRARKVVTAITPPIPISTCALGDNISGCVLKSLLFSGTITKGIIKIEDLPKGGVEIVIEISNSGIKTAKSYKMDKSIFMVDLNIGVANGSLLSVYVKTLNIDEVINEVLLTMLWVPDRKSTNVENYIIDDLDSLANEYLKISE